jgi:hypothetical protein
MPRGELRSEVIALLRHGHNKRRPRAHGHDRRGQIPNMVPISERPAEIEERLVPGHWEGDTIKGKYNRSAVGTLVERSTLFTLLAKMNGTGAAAAVDGFTRVLDRVEAQKRLSITYDRGKEMALHETLTANTGVKVYFADPSRALAARRQREHQRTHPPVPPQRRRPQRLLPARTRQVRLAAQRKTEKVAGMEVSRRTLPPRLRLREILLKVLCTSMLNPAIDFLSALGVARFRLPVMLVICNLAATGIRRGRETP